MARSLERGWPVPRGRGASLLASWPPRRELSRAVLRFGQNKIQYRKLDWRILRAPTSTSTTTRRRPTSRPRRWRTRRPATTPCACSSVTRWPSRIPLIVYASHTDFEQTNILPFTPPEGLLGATDFLKRRVALPFRGNFAEFRHTLRHEMVHVFQLDLLIESYYQAPRHGAQLPALVDGGAGGALVRRARTRATRWSCATSR